tara:strand:+ start:23 stop:430 length:408 start_codon:yes stop_codon:yes gene_type:complete
MATSVTFNGELIQCDFLSRPVGIFEGRRDVAELFGVNGGSSITGGAKPQTHIVIVELNNFATQVSLFNYIRNTLNPTIGVIGTLVLAGTISETLTSCELVSISMINYKGQSGPLPNALGANKWTDHCKLTFKQMA